MNKTCDDAPKSWTCISVKGIDGCNAYERHMQHDTTRLETYVLVSYCTPVCVISAYNGRPDYLYANGASTCSASTKRHVKRFLLRHGFDDNAQRTVASMCNGLAYDSFMRFDVNINKRLTGGTWLDCNLTPPTVTVDSNGRLDMYAPRFGFYARNDQWVNGGKKAGFHVTHVSNS